MTDISGNDPRFSILPGTPYCSVLLPLDYPPTRDMRPRWGTTRPLIAGLAARFEAENAKYETFLELMLEQAANLKGVRTEFAHELLPEVAWNGVPFAPFDGVALYTMIKHHRPKRFVEIGSGISTCWAFRAISDGGLNTKITSIDPSPRAAIDAICDAVIRNGLETLTDLSIFDDLEPGDILFLDGSHRVFLNSDVTVFFIDVLPRLKPGVIVHIHDIALPWDYDAMFVNWHWSEQYMLAVYLMAARDTVEVLLPTAWACRTLTHAAFFTRNPIQIPNIDSPWMGGGSMWFTKMVM